MSGAAGLPGAQQPVRHPRPEHHAQLRPGGSGWLRRRGLEPGDGGGGDDDDAVGRHAVDDHPGHRRALVSARRRRTRRPVCPSPAPGRVVPPPGSARPPRLARSTAELSRTEPTSMTEPPDVLVLYEDAHVLAVSKPAGLLTQGTPEGEPTLEQAVRRYLADGRAGLPRDGPPPGPAGLGGGRLGEDPQGGAAARGRIRRPRDRKEYWAVVEAQGVAVGDAPGVWDDWLSRSAGADGVVAVAAPAAPGARRAVTRYQAGRASRLPDGDALAPALARDRPDPSAPRAGVFSRPAGLGRHPLRLGPAVPPGDRAARPRR